ncbi:bacterial regulatory s, gntR family protein [Collimonas arenae]|uniref:Bacterial regulatory s, gntR family protein n=1 Tax=Collimonas arenae TaxID=279058 RepID=A0A127QMC7_9BURK|nr:FadR/GntR family transcriptional regulator [Collimonas arenae]AMP01313.1 bacterial regulatory s, gntR family protein [Collimonas arenae]AMP11211.1 bacterial regulatory s, gntR family protein [Collimonas arenae]
MFNKLNANRTSLSDTVAQELLKKIETGEFGPGAKLPTEPVLSEQFGVSRTVVREAISRLKNEGAVEPRQGSGVYVSEQGHLRPLRIQFDQASSADAVLQIVELRRAIDAEVAALAATRRTPRQLKAIETALKGIEADVSAGGDGVMADVMFHRSIAEATGNPFLLQTLAFLSQYLEAATAVTRCNEARRDDFMRQVYEEHAAIAAAIAAGDALAARNAAQNHMFNAARRLAQGAADAKAKAPQKSKAKSATKTR